ncbi:PREDICTED: LOW QUALITY PROTEIN: nesprin-2-like [Cyprinodon variegatus]|uniref:LOW QUALITY PROTEIN: nesprin-2-like n=1 Tax=Cyprinodon variegatus TaxID=28743 RepID=UPI0007426E53|nr:PREDICTED: LOW QUALITY PROTEIN: nesprin-2-like [Cyprinodon variegatus]
MASGSEEDDGVIPLDIDNVHMLLQVEHEQIQKRTFTNWINAQLAKRCPPSYVSDLFLDLKDGSRLLDLLEVMSGQSMKRQRGRGVFQQRANIETALNFLKRKSIKLVNINIPDIIDGRPSIILGLVWTIILRCHIEELASALSFSSRHSSLDSVASLDSWSGSPIPASPVPSGRVSPLHRRFRVSAKKALLMWVRDQCKKVNCTVNVKDFKSSWRSGEVFLAILCSLRPELVDLSKTQTRSSLENLEEAFHLAERELHIPRLLDPQDVDVKDPDEKSIMTYVAQFLQYSNDMPSPEDHLQVSPSEQTQDVTCWLQEAYKEISETWTATEGSTYAEKYQVYESLTASFAEQRRSVMRLLAATRRCPELDQEQKALRTAWERLEQELRRCEADVEQSLPPPLDSVAMWLQRGEAALTEEGRTAKDHAEAAKQARAKQDQLKTLIKEMNHYVKLTDTYHNVDDSGNMAVPQEKLGDIKNRVTGIRVSAKYEIIKLEYEENYHTVLDLLREVRAKVQTWKAPYTSQESVQVLLLDWHETIEHQGLLLILIDALQSLKDKMNVYTSKASLGGNSQRVTRQVKEAESEAEQVKQSTATAKEMMERVVSAWDVYSKSLSSLEAWLAQSTAAETQGVSEWASCHAQLNEVGNFLIEMTEASVRVTLVKQISKVNLQWAERMKKTVFEVLSVPKVGSSSIQMSDSLIQEANLLMRLPLEVSSVPLKDMRQKLQSMRTKLGEVDVSSNIPSADLQTPLKENLKKTLLKLAEAERLCGELQRGASKLEGCVAELDHWSTEALDCYEQLMEKKRKGGRSAFDSAAKVLISRGMMLTQQVVAEWQCLEDFVSEQQKASLQHLSTADMQVRIAATVSQTQEILEKLSSCGFKKQIGDFCEQIQLSETLHPQTGSYVQARTKQIVQARTKQIVNVKRQIPELVQVPDQGTTRPQVSKLQPSSTEERKGTVSLVEIKTTPEPVMVPLRQHQCSVQTERPALSIHAAGSVTVETKRASYSHGQSIKQKSGTASQPNIKLAPSQTQPPPMIRSEVHSKAQSMARSRLEKARVRLQGRIQQAIKLFGGREMTESHIKKKQKALNILQPAMLEEFLGAVEAFGAFCSGPQLQDLMLLSDSVRNQWEGVRREMADFISIQKCKIKVEQPFSVGITFTNALHEAADQTDLSSLQHGHQDVTQGTGSIEERFQVLGELCETLTLEKSPDLPTDPQTEPDKEQKTQLSLATFLPKSRGRQLEVNTPLSLADMQPSCSLTPVQSLDRAQQDILPLGKGVHAQRLDDALQLRVQDVPSGKTDHLMQSQGDGWEKKEKPSLRAEEQLLRARLLHLPESNQQAQSHIQAVVRSNTVESKQEAEWTVIPEPAVLTQMEPPPKEDPQGRKIEPLKKASYLMESADNWRTITAHKLDQIVRRSVDVSSLVLVESTVFSELKEIDETLKEEMGKLSKRGSSQPSLCQPLLSDFSHLEQLRQQLEEVQSTIRDLDNFLATLKNIKAENPTLMANWDPNKEGERLSGQSTMARLKHATEKSHIIDDSLKAMGMTLTMDGTSVTCQVLVDLVFEQMTSRRKEIQNREDMGLKDTWRNDSAKQDQGQSATSVKEEEESMLEVKRMKQEGDDKSEMQKLQGDKVQVWGSEEGFSKNKDQRQRTTNSQAGRDENDHESLVQRKSALLDVLRETKATAERLELMEASIPALQQRTRALTELESRLANLGSEVQYIRDAFSKPGIAEENQSSESEGLWKETMKATSERLEQTVFLTELLRKFQSMHSELSGTLQRAETTIGEQASYIGRDYLQRLNSKVKETKEELNGLGDDIEEVRCISRQFQSLLCQIPGCNAAPFEREADALMDRWLDLSERTDSHLENFHLCLTIWDGLLQMGEEVESWTKSRIAVLSQCPSFQTEDDLKRLQNEIMTQEESAERFHQRVAEIQSLLQSAETPLELQVAETQMNKKIEQVKELFLESMEVYNQMVATMGQISERMTESLSSLQRIQDSLHNLSGHDVETVLGKLKELCRQLHTEEEQVQSLLEDVQVLASIATPESLQSLSVSGIKLEEKIKNTHQLFSEVEEQTERNIKHLDRLRMEKEQLEKWLHTAEEKARKVKDRSLLQEEILHERGRTELIAKLVSSLRSSNLPQSLLLDQSSELLERYHNLLTNIGSGLQEATTSVTNDLEIFQGLVKSIQSWLEDLRQSVDFPLADACEIRTSAEQSLHCALTVLNVTTVAEGRLKELRVTGDCLIQRLQEEDLKQKVQATIQKTEEEWKNLLESVQPYYRALQDDLELTSLYLTSRQEACCKVKELQLQAEQLSAPFPWPGTAERAQASLLARQMEAESESLNLTLINLEEKRNELANKTRNPVWKDFSWDELETRQSALMATIKGLCARLDKGLSDEEHFDQLLKECRHRLTALHEKTAAFQSQKDSLGGLKPDAEALEALLKQVAEIEEDLLLLVTLRDSFIACSTAEGQASLSDQISTLQNHKRAIECGLKELIQPSILQEEKLQQVRRKAFLIQTDLSSLAKNVEELSVLPDIRQVTQQQQAMQDCDKRMTELATRVNDLKRMRETQETLPAEAAFTISTVLKDLSSLKSVFNKKKQEYFEATAETVRGLIGELKQCSRAAQVPTSSRSQVDQDKCFQLQQTLCDVLAKRGIFVDILGEEVMKTASEVLNESQQLSDSLSKRLVGCERMQMEERPNQGEDGCLSDEDGTTCLDVDEKAADMCDFASTPATDTDSHQNGDKSQHLTQPQTCLPGALKEETDPTKSTQEDSSIMSKRGSIMEVNKDDDLANIQAPCSDSKIVLETKVPSFGSGKINQQISAESDYDNQSQLGVIPSGNTTEIFTTETQSIEVLHRGFTSALVLDPSDSDSPNSSSNLPRITSLKESTESTVQTIYDVGKHLPTESDKFDAFKEKHSVSSTEVFMVKPEVETERMQQEENTTMCNPDVLRCSQEKDLTEFPQKATGFSPVGVHPESDKPPCMKAAHSEAFKEGLCAKEDRHDKLVSRSQDKVFTVVLDMHSWDIQPSGYTGASSPDGFRWSLEAQHCDIKLEDNSNSGFSEKKPTCLPISGSPGLHVKELESEATSLVSQIKSKENQSTQSKYEEALTLSKSHTFETEHSAETTFPVSKKEQNICQAEGKPESPALCSAEDPVPNQGETETAIQMNTSNNKHIMTGYGGMNTGEGAAQGGASDSECTDGKHCATPTGRESPSLLDGQNKRKPNGVLQETVLPLVKSQSRESMEPERNLPGLQCGPGAEELTGGSQGTYNYSSTLQERLSEIQGSVEQSHIIKGTPHMDLNLKSSPGDADIRLARTVQHVLACRYQPAQLNSTAMAKQLKDARELRQSVQEQMAAIKSNAATFSDPKALERAEKEWSSALLDASATVQVKEAQLDQVKQYHLKKKIITAFLEVIAAEKEKLSLNALESSSLLAEKLHALLQTMEQKESMIEDFLCLSSQLSVHLSDAETSVVFAQLGHFQEEWRLLKGSIKRADQQASNSACQAKLIISETEKLKTKLEALLKFKNNNISSSDLDGLTTDLKVYQQLYLHLQSQAAVLIRFSLGQKEKTAIEENLHNLKSLLCVTKHNLDSLAESCEGSSPSKINNQHQQLIILIKQAENHIFSGKRLSLSPEQACLQIAEMREYQMQALSRQDKIQTQVGGLRDEVSQLENGDPGVCKTADLNKTLVERFDHVLETMKNALDERKKVLCEFSSLDGWESETCMKRESCIHVRDVSKADLSDLERELKSHQSAAVKLETKLKLVDSLSERCTKLAVELSLCENLYLVDRLSGLWAEFHGQLAHEKAICWELEVLIHERTSSNEELSTIKANLEQTSLALEKQNFSLTDLNNTLSVITHLQHKLIEHQWEVQGLQHCQEDQRNSVLCLIGELNDQCKIRRINAVDQSRYLYLRGQTEASMECTKRQIEEAKNQSVSIAKRLRLCRTLLVELTLVSIQCQDTTNQLEAIANELQSTELHSEREKLQHMVETLNSWEHSVTDDMKNLEAQLLTGLQFSFELPTLMELLQRAKRQLEKIKQVQVDEKAIDNAISQCCFIRTNVESGMRVLESLAQKDNLNLEDYKELYSLRDVVMQEGHSLMVNLSQARESFKDYQWAAQGAIGFLHNAEATFLSAPGGFLDCTQEQRQTQEALEVLEDGFQAHIHHLVEKVPQHSCLSWPETESLHISILSQLLVGRAVLEAQAKLRQECLERCEIRQQTHKKWHEDVKQELLHLESKISECASELVTSYDECITQQKRAKVLKEDLQTMAGKLDDLNVGCPVQGCGVGKDGELGALWRHWTSLRRGVGLLLARAEQKGEEWKDITTSMEQSCSYLASLQAELPDASSVSFSQKEPQELLAQVELHLSGLDQEQQALLFLEHRLMHALGLKFSQDSINLGQIGNTREKIQESIRSLKEKSLLLKAAAEEEEKKRLQVQEEIQDVEKKMFAVLSKLEMSSNLIKKQELQENIFCVKSQLELLMGSLESRYTEIPTDIGKKMQNLKQFAQNAEETLLEMDNPVRILSRRVKELGSGLDKIKTLLEQRSPTIKEAQDVLKCVWDELDAWHSSLMLLESEVQDLAEDHPNEAQVLMDQLTEPSQLYRNASLMAENRTSFLSKIPACLQEFEDTTDRASSWIAEAQSWLSTPCMFTTAKSLHNHVKYIQLILEDSKRIRQTLKTFKSMLEEISAVCDVSSQEERLDQRDQEVQEMLQTIIQPLAELQQLTEIVEMVEADIKGMEKNVTKIRTILYSMDNEDITLTEHLYHCEAVLSQIQTMQQRLEDMENWKMEVNFPERAENLVVFSKARVLIEQLDELEQITMEQKSLLESKIEEQESTVSSSPEEIQVLENPAHRGFYQEAFEVSYSEEEEDEGDESHSSSSDTLTCSIPEDLEETINLSHEQREDMSEMNPQDTVKEVESTAHEADKYPEEPGGGVLYLKPGFEEMFGQNAGTGDVKEKVYQTFIPETVTESGLNDEPVTTDERNITAASSALQESSKQETFDISPQINSPLIETAVKETHLIPSRPITPFWRKKPCDEHKEDDDTHLCLSPTNHSHAEVLKGLKEPKEVNLSTYRGIKGTQKSKEIPDATPGSPGYEDDVDNLPWSHLCTHISTKLSFLRRALDDKQTMIFTDDGEKRKTVSEEEISASSALQQIHDTTAMMGQMLYEVTASSSPHLDVKKKMYETLQRVLHCLNSLTHLLTPKESLAGDPQLMLLQLECLSAQLVTMTELMGKMESQIRPSLLVEESEAQSCLTSLQDYLHMVQLLLNSSHNQLVKHSGLQNQDQTVFLLKQVEDSLTAKWTSHIPNRSKLQVALCRRKKLLQVFRSQLSFLQFIFQHEPNALKSQEDEWLHLEARAKDLQQQVLEEEITSQKRLKDWIRWEKLCGQLGGMLDESEAFIGREPEGDDDDEEETIERRLHACEQTLLQLEESRALLGALLDHRAVLQAEPWFSTWVRPAGGALELRWKSVYRHIEQEILRLRNIQESRSRFQADLPLVSECLLGASKHLKTLSDLADSSNLSQETLQRSLVELLDLSMELEATSAQKESLSKEVTRLLHLKEVDCPELRGQILQLEANCTQLTSDLSKIQELLLQRLVPAQPPLNMLPRLEKWMKEREAQLNQQKERVPKAQNAAEIAEILQHCRVLRIAVGSLQQLIDFMSQPGANVATENVQTRRFECTTFAEKLGSVRLQWLLLQRELDIQIHELEHIHHACAERERHLQRLHSWTEQQKSRMNQWKQSTGQTLARYAVVELEADLSRIKEVSAALQELKTVQIHYEKEKKLLCDGIFCDQAESVRRTCIDLYQQMEDIKPVLEETVEKWTCFHRALGDVALYTTRACCALQQQQAPLFSLQQAEGYLGILEDLQVKVEAEGEQFWTAADKSYKGLVETLPDGSAQPLSDQVEELRKGSKDILQEIRDEQKKIRQTISLWHDYAKLSQSIFGRRQHLWNEWETSSSPGNDAEASVCSLKRLQDAAEELQNNAGDVVAASKGLLGRLEPLSASLIKSEARLLTRDILLLNQAISGKRQNLEEDLELETLGLYDTDPLQALLKLSNTIPSLEDVRETSGNINIDEEMERVQPISRQWMETFTQATDENKTLQGKPHSTRDFQEKREKLKRIQENLERESACRKSLSYSNLKQILIVHQNLQAEVINGHQLLQGLLCDAVKATETETGEKRSELMREAACLRRSWSSSVALAADNWCLTKEHLKLWRKYQHGFKQLKKLFREVDSILPPTGPCLHTVQQLHFYQNVHPLIDDSLGLHSSVYTQTVEAGNCLCEIVTESESQNQLQSELQDLQKAWERTASHQRKNRDLINNTVQMWSRSQKETSNILSGLDKVSHLLAEGPEDSKEEAQVQEAELLLQHLEGGLRELATMKTDLSQYVAASDSALLEQQLELLHTQWEELCLKVSLRRQEIADRLDAWTIFNDKNKEFCDWLMQMENKVCHSADLCIEEMVEKLKKDCMEEINLFSENKSHLKQLGEQLLLASDEAKQTQVCGSLQEVNQRWQNLFPQIEARVKKLKETLAKLQQLDKNMSNLRSWLSRIEAELSRPITYSVCHEKEIQKRLAEQQDLQRDIEQHTEGVASVLSLCDTLLHDDDAAGGFEAESDSLQETSRSLDQQWRTICALALERRLRIEETWTLWCKFLNDYSHFEDWLKIAERMAASPNSADVLYSVAKEELKKFEVFQRQVNERLTQLELINNQYRRLARENRTDRASQLKAMVREGNQRWDSLHRRVAAILRRLKFFTSQREEFEGTRESMLVWLTELDLQLTNVEHFSESDVHQKIQQLNSFQKEITLNTERIDGLIVFGEALIQKSSPQDAALIEDELEELHSYCQEVFSRLVRFHQRLSQPPRIREEPDITDLTFSLESSLELIGRPWLGRQLSLPATPTHLLSSPLECSGRETPVSVDSLPLEWDHTGDVGGSSSHEDDEEDEEHKDGGAYFSALSVSSRSVLDHSWRTPETTAAHLEAEGQAEPSPALTSTPLKDGYLQLMSQCSGSIENIKRVSLILDDDDEEQPDEFGLTGLNASDNQSGVIERWELLRAQSRCSQQSDTQDPQQITVDLDRMTSWLENVIPELDRLRQSEPEGGIEDIEVRAKELKEMEKVFCHYKTIMLSVNLQAKEAPELQDRLTRVNADWSRACTGLQQWDHSLRKKLIRCQEFHETLHSLLLWLPWAESRCCAVDIKHPETSVKALQKQQNTLRELQVELRGRQANQASLQALWSQLQPKDGAEEMDEAQEKLHVTCNKLRQLTKKVDQDLSILQQRLLIQDADGAEADTSQEADYSKTESSLQRYGACRECMFLRSATHSRWTFFFLTPFVFCRQRDSSPPRSFFYRLFRAIFPLQLLLLLLLLLPCLIPLSESDSSCTVTNNFARSFYPMLHYTNGPPPT